MIPRKHQEPGQPNCRNRQVKNMTREVEFPQKKAGTQAGPQHTNPSPNKRPRKKNPGEKTEGEGAARD